MIQKRSSLPTIFFVLLWMSVSASAAPRVAINNEIDLTKLTAAFTAELKAHPDNAEAYFNRGTLYLRMGNFVAAMADLKQALAQGANFADVYNNLAVLELERGDSNAAFKRLEQANAANPQMSDAYVNRGILHLRCGDKDSALMDFNRVIALDSRCAPAFAARGVLHALNGQNAMAKADMEKALSLDAYENAFQYNLGVFWAAAGEFQKSSDYFERVSPGPLKAAASYWEGQALLHRAEYDAAMRAFYQAAELGLDRGALNENQGYILQPAISALRDDARLQELGGIADLYWGESSTFGSSNARMQFDGKQTVITYTSNYRGADKSSRVLTPAETERFSRQLMALRPDEWAERYDAGYICGVSWAITIRFADGSSIGADGSNAFPPHYREAISLLYQPIPEDNDNEKSEG